MKGTIRSKAKCKQCKGPFQGDRLVCACGIPATSAIYIDMHHEGQRLKVYSDSRGLVFESQRHALRTLERIRNEIDDKTFSHKDYRARDQRELLFENYADKWLKIKQSKGLRPGTIDKLKSHVRSLKKLLRGRDIREVRGSHLEQIAIDLAETHMQNTTTVMVSTLRQIFRDAERWEDIDRSPVFPRMSLAQPKIVLPSDEAREAIFQAIPKKHRAIFSLLKHHPIRPVEARRLLPSDIDLKEGLVHIRKEIRKAGEGYMIPLHPETKQILEYLSQDVVAIGEQPLFLNGQKPYTEDMLGYYWRKAAALAGHPDVQLYAATRHWIATAAVNAGIDIGTVAAALGHSSPTTTARYYAKYKPATLAQVIMLTGPIDRTQTGPKSGRTTRK